MSSLNTCPTDSQSPASDHDNSFAINFKANFFLKYGSRIFERFLQFYNRLLAQRRLTRRFLTGKLKTTVVGVALLLAFSHTPTHAATITTSDGGDSRPTNKESEAREAREASQAIEAFSVFGGP